MKTIKQLDDIFKVLKENKNGVCLMGGLSHTPYRWIWDNRPPVPRIPSFFSSQNSPDSSHRSPKVPWDWTFLGKSGHGWSILDLILPFSEPLLTLDTSHPILSLCLHQDPHSLLPQMSHSTACGFQLYPGKPKTLPTWSKKILIKCSFFKKMWLYIYHLTAGLHNIWCKYWWKWRER